MMKKLMVWTPGWIIKKLAVTGKVLVVTQRVMIVIPPIVTVMAKILRNGTIHLCVMSTNIQWLS